MNPIPYTLLDSGAKTATKVLCVLLWDCASQTDSMNILGHMKFQFIFGLHTPMYNIEIYLRGTGWRLLSGGVPA
jgi:hypothetical protein